MFEFRDSIYKRLFGSVYEDGLRVIGRKEKVFTHIWKPSIVLVLLLFLAGVMSGSRSANADDLSPKLVPMKLNCKNFSQIPKSTKIYGSLSVGDVDLISCQNTFEFKLRSNLSLNNVDLYKGCVITFAGVQDPEDDTKYSGYFLASVDCGGRTIRVDGMGFQGLGFDNSGRVCWGTGLTSKSSIDGITIPTGTNIAFDLNPDSTPIHYQKHIYFIVLHQPLVKDGKTYKYFVYVHPGGRLEQASDEITWCE